MALARVVWPVAWPEVCRGGGEYFDNATILFLYGLCIMVM